MARGSNFITPVLFVAIGIALVVLFYPTVQDIVFRSATIATRDVSAATRHTHVSIVYARGEYNSVSGQSHVCVSVISNADPVPADGASITVRSIATGATLATVTNPAASCVTISEVVPCSFCGDFSVGSGEYFVEFRCDYCHPVSSRLRID